jgi:hypothetical protein
VRSQDSGLRTQDSGLRKDSGVRWVLVCPVVEVGRTTRERMRVGPGSTSASSGSSPAFGSTRGLLGPSPPPTPTAAAAAAAAAARPLPPETRPTASGRSAAASTAGCGGASPRRRICRRACTSVAVGARLLSARSSASSEPCTVSLIRSVLVRAPRRPVRSPLSICLSSRPVEPSVAVRLTLRRRDSIHRPLGGQTKAARAAQASEDPEVAGSRATDARVALQPAVLVDGARAHQHRALRWALGVGGHVYPGRDVPGRPHNAPVTPRTRRRRSARALDLHSD